ncbi:MAG: ABC transporter permease, partial [Lachnospiraceae bacterium]|nr:ABC transporter permease [Lachnospiraceae bacterium]
VGALPRIGFGAKIGILTAVSLALCAMSDLMAQGVRDLIEHHAPIINDMNPAALISDSFYALNVYDTYERVTGNLLLLGGGAVVWGIVCYFMIRRSRYASL